jgi:hypothetical protein
MPDKSKNAKASVRKTAAPKPKGGKTAVDWKDVIQKSDFEEVSPIPDGRKMSGAGQAGLETDEKRTRRLQSAVCAVPGEDNGRDRGDRGQIGGDGAHRGDTQKHH